MTQTRKGHQEQVGTFDWVTSVLVVEDEDPIRELVARVLAGNGYRVVAAGSAEEALRMLEEQVFGLVISDVMLGGMSGWELVEEIGRRGLRQRTKVMLLTARGAEADMVHGWGLEIDQYCTKPFDPDELVAAVEDVLVSPRERLERRRENERRRAQLLHRVEVTFASVADRGRFMVAS